MNYYYICIWASLPTALTDGHQLTQDYGVMHYSCTLGMYFYRNLFLMKVSVHPFICHHFIYEL